MHGRDAFSWKHTITGEQLRAARALARIDQVELALRSRLSVETIKRLERVCGPVDANVRTLRAIVEAFEIMGVGFRVEDGMESVWRMRRPEAAAPQAQPSDDVRRIVLHGELARSDARHDAVPALRGEDGAHLTGMRIVCDGRVLQAMEGASDVLQGVYATFAKSPALRALTLMDNRVVPNRLFAGWRVWEDADPRTLMQLGLKREHAEGFQPKLLSVPAALGLLLQASDGLAQASHQPFGLAR